MSIIQLIIILSRFTITSTKTTNDDIIKDWSEIRAVTTEILEENNFKIGDRARVPLKDTRAKNEAFGSSLLLANSPMSPKIVNGSFAAIFDTDEFITKVYAGIRMTVSNNIYDICINKYVNLDLY